MGGAYVRVRCVNVWGARCAPLIAAAGTHVAMRLPCLCGLRRVLLSRKAWPWRRCRLHGPLLCCRPRLPAHTERYGQDQERLERGFRGAEGCSSARVGCRFDRLLYPWGSWWWSSSSRRRRRRSSESYTRGARFLTRWEGEEQQQQLNWNMPSKVFAFSRSKRKGTHLCGGGE